MIGFSLILILLGLIIAGVGMYIYKRFKITAYILLTIGLLMFLAPFIVVAILKLNF